jgi:hypothetical protein
MELQTPNDHWVVLVQLEPTVEARVVQLASSNNVKKRW